MFHSLTFQKKKNHQFSLFFPDVGNSLRYPKFHPNAYILRFIFTAGYTNYHKGAKNHKGPQSTKKDCFANFSHSCGYCLLIAINVSHLLHCHCLFLLLFLLLFFFPFLPFSPFLESGYHTRQIKVHFFTDGEPPVGIF